MAHGEKCTWRSEELRDIMDLGARLLGPNFIIHVSERPQDTPCKLDMKIRGIEVEVSYLPYSSNMAIFIGQEPMTIWIGLPPEHLIAEGEQRDIGPLVAFVHQALIEYLQGTDDDDFEDQYE